MAASLDTWWQLRGAGYAGSSTQTLSGDVHSFFPFFLCQISEYCFVARSIAAPVCVKRSRLLDAPQVISTQKYLKWRLSVDSSCRYGSGRSDLELLQRDKAERLRGWEAEGGGSWIIQFFFPLQALKLTNAPVLWERFLVFGAGDCESVLISCCGKMGGWFIYSTSLPGSEADLCRYCSSCKCAARKKLGKNKLCILCVCEFCFMTTNLLKHFVVTIQIVKYHPTGVNE